MTRRPVTVAEHLAHAVRNPTPILAQHLALAQAVIDGCAQVARATQQYPKPEGTHHG